jgi:hypothetical protein
MLGYLGGRLGRVVARYTFDRPVLVDAVCPAVVLNVIECYLPELGIFAENHDLWHLLLVLGARRSVKIIVPDQHDPQTEKPRDYRKHGIPFHHHFPLNKVPFLNCLELVKLYTS